MPPSACCRMETSSASVNTTPLARTASAAGRASKPSPGRLVPTCQHPMEPPTHVRTQNMFICSYCVDPTRQADTQLDTMLLTPFTCFSYGCWSACLPVLYSTWICLLIDLSYNTYIQYVAIQYYRQRMCPGRGLSP